MSMATFSSARKLGSAWAAALFWSMIGMTSSLKKCRDGGWRILRYLTRGRASPGSRSGCDVNNLLASLFLARPDGAPQPGGSGREGELAVMATNPTVGEP